MTQAYAISASAIAAEYSRHNNDPKQVNVAKVIALEQLTLPEVGPRDVRFRTLAVSVEHNVGHAVKADTMNIAEFRGGKIYPGNSAIGEVVEVGEDVTDFALGDVVLTHCNGDPDEYGYPRRIWAYDQPESIGWYAEECVVGDWQLIQAPLECGLSLWEMAALPLRAPTAYHMWRRAEGMLRVKMSEEQLPTMNVLGFGGGVSELFLLLAKHRGHNAFFCSGSQTRRAALEKHGIVGIDQQSFNRFASEGDIKAFGKEVKRRTGGAGMHIVCDMLRGPCFGAGITASSRQGVNISAGWQLDTRAAYNSAGASVKQITLDHVHYETPVGIKAATSLYGSVFKPTVHREIYDFDELPRAIDEMTKAIQTGIPVVRVAKDMPVSVHGLI